MQWSASKLLLLLGANKLTGSTTTTTTVGVAEECSSAAVLFHCFHDEDDASLCTSVCSSTHTHTLGAIKRGIDVMAVVKKGSAYPVLS